MKIKKVILIYPTRPVVWELGDPIDGQEVTEIRADRARDNVVFKIVSDGKIMREIVTPSYEIVYEHMEVLG